MSDQEVDDVAQNSLLGGSTGFKPSDLAGLTILGFSLGALPNTSGCSAHVRLYRAQLESISHLGIRVVTFVFFALIFLD